MIQRVLRAGGCGLAGEVSGVWVTVVGKTKQVVGKDMFQKKMEGGAVVMMSQMTQFMEQDIVAQNRRETDDVKIQVDVVPGRAAAPVGGVVLDGQSVEYESVTCCQFVQTRRQLGLGTAAQLLDFPG